MQQPSSADAEEKVQRDRELVSACNGNINSMHRITPIFRDLSKKASVLLLKQGLTKSLSMEDDTTATTKSTACCGGNTKGFRMCKRTFIPPTCTNKKKKLKKKKRSKYYAFNQVWAVLGTVLRGLEIVNTSSLCLYFQTRWSRPNTLVLDGLLAHVGTGIKARRTWGCNNWSGQTLNRRYKLYNSFQTLKHCKKKRKKKIDKIQRLN